VDVAEEPRRDAARERHHVGAEREVRHEMRVHDVEVQRVRAGPRHAGDFRAERADVLRSEHHFARSPVDRVDNAFIDDFA